MEFVVSFSEGKPNPSLLGGKGSNLIKLVKIGMNVPRGFIVNINAYKKFLAESDYTDQLMEIFSKKLEPKKIMQDSAKIQDLILKSAIPKEIVNDIKKGFEEICLDDSGISFAVRSSATIEDSSKFSFAGQADSFLYNKTFDEILISLKKCWASLFSTRAMLYLLQMRKQGLELSLSDIQMAVVIQKMVNSEIAGVLFTANIVTNDLTQMYLNCTWGLGESIADNSVNADTIIVNKNNFEIVKRIIGKKEKKSIQNPEASGTIMIDTEPRYCDICSLNENQLRQVYNMGIKIESAFNYPQDIEWAIENDVLYILQTRPITTLRK
jgi:pyruvate,water dikinase